MRTSGSNRRLWRIGELAEATGLTVRTLHHYEQLGLLGPLERSAGRQRLYDERDLRRIYRICALRDLGLPLAEIGRLLGQERPALAEVLRAHRLRIDAEIERLERLRVMLEHLGSGHSIEPDAMLATIEAMSRVVRHGEAQRRRGQSPKDTEVWWRALGKDLRACMRAGTPPSAPRALALARMARARISAFAGGDRATLEALAHLRRFAPPKDLAGWNPALIQYLDQALTSLSAKE